MFFSYKGFKDFCGLVKPYKILANVIRLPNSNFTGLGKYLCHWNFIVNVYEGIFHEQDTAGCDPTAQAEK